jgi:hypothetical protein
MSILYYYLYYHNPQRQETVAPTAFLLTADTREKALVAKRTSHHVRCLFFFFCLALPSPLSLKNFQLN